MEAGTIFTSVVLMMLANSAVLAVVSRDLPPTLLPAATSWQLGTMLIATGCAVFAFGAALPRPLMLVTANGLIVFGLTAYHIALQIFDGIPRRARQLLPASIATLSVFWFSTVTPNFQVRVAVVSVVWIWLLCACIVTLLGSSQRDASRSRKILIGIFGLVTAYALVRAIVYLTLGLRSDFAVETDANWLNLLSPIFMTLLPIIGTTAFLLMCSDNLKRQLETAASTDYLTGLPNRRTFAKHGKTSFQVAEEEGIGFAVAILDIDNFKQINDTYGHAVGDQVLVYVANQLQEQTSALGIVARIGGEEFAVLANGSDHEEAIEAIERMRVKVEQAEFNIGTGGIFVTVSAGIAVYRAGDGAFDDLLRRADKALYSAKKNGRNRVEIALPHIVTGQSVRAVGQ